MLHFSIFARPAKQWHVDRTERERESREREREESSERASREVGESGPRPEGVPTWIFRDFPSTESSDLDPCRRATVGLGGFEQFPSDTEKQA